ncbi:hypothetical protein JAAARDRAFT_34718 [Jaapia argillacea MUCL 33604]|uniref:Sodium/calcium exchanger membrane region domain-containing protein n=1 Tax=Jaapia argillacea MUCL 33604 TaxID=933084 RepID=A0A067Q5N9_9AGAM|nr:hypothetical protein JAAARDRAFT_34718 [Jaapia argillacea MUCL 33604]
MASQGNGLAHRHPTRSTDEEHGISELKTAQTPSDSAENHAKPEEFGLAEEIERGLEAADEGIHRFWNRLCGKGRKRVSWTTSFVNMVTFSWINVLLIFIPLAWVSHFMKSWAPALTFTFCFLAIIPLENIFDFGGEQMAFYLGKDLGDLLVVTLNNAVEATLAILLLTKCELKLLQSTIIGVVVLHLLLVPGTAFLTGGARIWEQQLHPHTSQLNLSLLAIGVMSLLLPSAFYAALDRGNSPGLESDHIRGMFLKMSRGMAIILLVVYIGSRIYLHNPPGDHNALLPHPNAPEDILHQEQELEEGDPEVNPWACIAMLVVTIGIMAATAEWLVQSIEFVRHESNIQQEWFGLILIPLVSFSADGAVAIVFFARYSVKLFFGAPSPPATLAKARAIDLSIQFVLWWMPFLVLLAWWIGKPLTLLFDFFEVALVLGSCFLVNYITADGKTNWVEGLVMVSFYFMIALVSWFYTGQVEIDVMLSCESVAAALAAGSTGA